MSFVEVVSNVCALLDMTNYVVQLHVSVAVTGPTVCQGTYQLFGFYL